jgi:hypothetical protein
LTYSIEGLLADSYWCVHNITNKSERKEFAFVDTVTELVLYTYHNKQVTEIIFKHKKNYCYYLAKEVEEPVKRREYEVTYTLLNETEARITTMKQISVKGEYIAL